MSPWREPAGTRAVVTVAQMRELERAAVERGVSEPALMANAGRAVAHWIDAAFPAPPRRLLCLVGPGNNGGDGLVAAAELARRGWQVSAALWSRRREPDAPLAEARAAGVDSLDAQAEPKSLGRLLDARPVLLDALFGIGHLRAFAEPLRRLLQEVRRAVPRDRIVALDTPSGVDADAGTADPATLPAGTTLMLGAAKLGLLRFPAAELTGRLLTLPIGLPEGLADDIPLRLLDDAWVAALLPARPLSANKGTFGRAAIVAGSANYPGAAALTSSAAVRSGAGLVTLAATRRVGLLAAAHVLEPTHLELPETPEGGVDGAGAGALLAAIRDYDALLIGPGLGRAPGTAELVRRVLAGWHESGRAAVIDADALNLLAERAEWWSTLAGGNVLTPHPGEMSRLLGGEPSAREIDRDRFEIAPTAAARWGQIVVLKGAHTVIAAPDGRVAICPVATPALATAGSGDVLAGTITGLFAQRLDPWAAALAGVFVHARAGLLVEAEIGAAGAAAGDLLPRLPRVLQDLRAQVPA